MFMDLLRIREQAYLHLQKASVHQNIHNWKKILVMLLTLLQLGVLYIALIHILYGFCIYLDS